MKHTCVPGSFILLAAMTAAVCANEPEPVRLIFDTDMMGDVDDVGTAAVLHAVRGLDEGLADYWVLQMQGYLHVNEDGSNEWRNSPDKDHAYLVRKMDPKKIGEVIEELMLQPPHTKQ